MTNPYEEIINRLLSPLVGDFIAKMALKSQCKALGITPDSIGPQHLTPLSKKIGDALTFHGYDKGEISQIVEMIKNMK